MPASSMRPRRSPLYFTPEQVDDLFAQHLVKHKNLLQDKNVDTPEEAEARKKESDKATQKMNINHFESVFNKR